LSLWKNKVFKAFEKMYYDNFFRELCAERGLIRAKNFNSEKCAAEIMDFISQKTV